MRLRIRTLLLTIALLVGLAVPADACCFIPILDPFHWLFGCGCYQGGYGGGYSQPQAYGNPGGCGYQPAYQGLTSPCAPCAPACLPTPICVRPLPMPAIFRQALDPCGYQCSAQMMPAQMMPTQMIPAPMVQYQPTQFAPQQAYAPAMESGCCSDDMMAQGMESYDPGMQGWSPSSPVMGWSPQGSYPGGGFPSLARHSSLPPTGYGLFVRPGIARRETRQVIHQYRRMRSQAPSYPGQKRGPLMVPAPYSYPQAMYQQSMYQQPMYQPAYSGEMGYPQMQQYEYPSAPMMQQAQPFQQSEPQQPTTPQAMLPQSYPQMQSTMMPMQMMYSNQNIASDVMGDHEYSTSPTAMVPVIQNSYSGTGGSSPFSRATLTRSLPFLSSQYSKSVR